MSSCWTGEDPRRRRSRSGPHAWRVSLTLWQACWSPPRARAKAREQRSKHRKAYISIWEVIDFFELRCLSDKYFVRKLCLVFGTQICYDHYCCLFDWFVLNMCVFAKSNSMCVLPMEESAILSTFQIILHHTFALSQTPLILTKFWGKCINICNTK